MIAHARRAIVVPAVLIAGCRAAAPAPEAAAPSYALPASATWQKLDTPPYPGKQDDIVFVTPTTGWYVNGAGKIYKTVDGGTSWKEQLSKPGTYFRAIGFVDDQLGFAGNIGTDYFPNVRDTLPLYRTRDGGVTWAPVTTATGPSVKGICAIDVLHTQYINAGVMATRTVIHAGGRVGGPAMLMRSMDGGETWRTLDLSAHTAMILDVKFFTESEGLVMGASDADVAKSHAVVLRTIDGGTAWTRVYESTRPFELTWKGSFPSRRTGYITVQSYNPDTSAAQRYVAKTVDGGRTWTEIPLARQFRVREFGVGFADEKLGWVGSTDGGFQTTDGGVTWTLVPMGRAVNKIRIVPDGRGFVGYAIGLDVRKLSAPESASR